MSDKIVCKLCNAEVHSIQMHLKSDHPELAIADYQERFPGAPIMSDLALKKIEERRAAAAAAKAAPADGRLEMAGTAAAKSADDAVVPTALTPVNSVVKKPLNVVFGLGTLKAAMSSTGNPIPISVIVNPAHPEMVPEINDTYVYDADELKNVILALELNINPYVWGHKGSGKTELFEQTCARTGRGFMRVQHTINTEESHIIGQWTVQSEGGVSKTVFELGPLPQAMINGWTYCADEYDACLPSVNLVYQAVMEGKSLMIKEADAANRIIKPHPNFRFVATGNTNGSGDETGLYQGTNIQNSANYDRFGMMIHKQYMSAKSESLILQNKVGMVKEDADKMVEFAGLVRQAYDAAKISDVISPRALISAGKIGIKRMSFRQGLTLSFINKLSKVDREVVDGLATRVFPT
jgi:cobaltochelatase CobS